MIAIIVLELLSVMIAIGVVVSIIPKRALNALVYFPSI